MINLMSRTFLARMALGIVLTSMIVPGTIRAAAPPFPDMDVSWFVYRESVAFLASRGAVGGYEDGTFKPRATVNRAEFLKMIFAVKANAEPAGGDCFTDVPADAWFAPYVCAAKRRGIVAGYRDGSFKPDQAVNAAEAIKMIVKTFGSDAEDGKGEQWYAPYAKELDDDGVLARSSYVAWDPLSRERAADLIAKMVRFDEDRVIARHSPGCGKARASAPTTIAVNGLDRTFLLTEPQRASSTEPSPLIVAFHGRTNSNEMVRKYYGIDKHATEFFIAYPAALDGTGTFHWSDPGNTPARLRDIAFFDAIVETLGDAYCIDMDRIYVVGHSLGAWFANSIACVRGGAVRGSATVGGSSVITDCTGPSAAMIINNPKDASSPQAGAEAVREMRLRENACGASSGSSHPLAYSCVSYDGCGRNAVYWCPHTMDTDERGVYYPHNWPRGTGEEIAEFFRNLD